MTRRNGLALPLLQSSPWQECRKRGILIIYDEVFCGLWRLGVESARELLREDPDVSCYAKLLTGGLVPMAATVATENIFEAFRGTKVGWCFDPLTGQSIDQRIRPLFQKQRGLPVWLSLVVSC